MQNARNMFRVFTLVILAGLFFSSMLFGQNRSNTYIDLNRDTILEVYDKDDRLIEKYINGFISEKFEYEVPEPVTLARLVVKVSQLTKPEFKYPLEEGDSVTILVCEQKRRKIKQIDFIQGDKGNRFSTVKADSVYWTDIIEEPGEYKLKIHNFLSLFKRVCCVKVVRYPKVDTTIIKYVRDTFTLIDTVPKVTSRDTFLIPIIDKTIYLPPVRDIERMPYQIEKFELPLRQDSLGKMHSWSYWLGIGDKPNADYLALEASIPDSWSKPGVTKTLGAFLLGNNVVLPAKPNNNVGIKLESSSVIRNYVNNLNPSFFEKNLSFRYFRKIAATQSRRTNYLLIANKDEVNGYSIPIKIIAMKIKENIEDVEEKRQVIGKPRREDEPISKPPN